MRKISFPTVFVLLAMALASCKPGIVGSVDQVEVAAEDGGKYDITWRATGGAVDVYVADQADVPKDQMRLLVDDTTDGKASVTVAGKNRPYFYVTADGGKGLWAAERVLPLAGGRNFRDLGGYVTSDGKRVRWGKIYRSGSMADLTPADYQYLSTLGIKTVCDLRTNRERDVEPNRWVKDANIAYWTRDYEMSTGDLGALLTRGITPNQARQTMAESYRNTPNEQALAYREIFQQLANGDIPLAFNCSAGKDRTGIAAALILSALGVPDETVFADYAMSEKVLGSSNIMNDPRSVKAWGALAKLPPDVLQALTASDSAYINAAFDTIREKYGSVAGYVRDELGITDSQMSKIRSELLE